MKDTQLFGLDCRIPSNKYSLTCLQRSLTPLECAIILYYGRFAALIDIIIPAPIALYCINFRFFGALSSALLTLSIEYKVFAYNMQQVVYNKFIVIGLLTLRGGQLQLLLLVRQ